MMTLFTFLFVLTLYWYSTSAQLLPTDPDVYEGGCIRNFIPVKENTFSPIETALFSTFGSQAHWRLLSEAFLGHPASTQAEIDRICHSFILTDVTVNHICYGNRIYIANGVMNPPNVFTWPHTPLLKSPGVFDLPYVSTIIWTDPDHILFADCFDNRINKWKLVSKKLPTDQVKAEVLKQIEFYGFNKSLAWDMTNPTQTGHPYECLQTPYSFSEATAQILLALNAFDNASPIYHQLPQQVTYLGQGYSTLADYYSVLLGPMKPFIKEAIEHCGAVGAGQEYYSGAQYPNKSEHTPLGCQLFD